MTVQHALCMVVEPASSVLSGGALELVDFGSNNFRVFFLEFFTTRGFVVKGALMCVGIAM